MAKDKSVLDKFTDTVKDIANKASEALKPEEPQSVKAEKTAAGYVPLASDGIVSDPLLVPPLASAPRRRKRAAPNRSKPEISSKATRNTGKKSNRRARSKSSVGKQKATRKAAERPSRAAAAKRSASKTAKRKAPTRRRRGG
jgi:hypothetical protein